MSKWLKQSTAVDLPVGPFLDETDGKTAETALTITQPDVRLKKNGGAWAQKNAAQTLSHEENGWYEVSLDTTDTNTLGLLKIAVHESGALPVWDDYLVVPANVYDSVVGGSDTLQVDLTQINGSTAVATKFEKSASTIETGTVAAGSTTSTINTSDLTEATNDHYKDRWLIFVTGAAARQAKQITGYNGTTKALTTGVFQDAPATSDTFVIV
jgi:hypothetical protein